MKQQNFSIKKRLQSFKYAFNGLKILIKEEHNARIHLLATIIVLVAGVIFKLSVYEWVIIVLAIGFVIAIEIINTTIENIADIVSPQKHDAIKKIKDISAAGVLISAITALILGLLIFIPKIVALC
ncbi:MAG: diacylglycerol kinase [Bacteroidetes bacterium HGW-Bacteroidetes-21]|jgi:undecaprenol kinase/diacylglycerol kinase (ATP)|nr:MAG: diacylglycerol kinase [Bacteroidetes bacterium HGW-Bacteroidetes-21]